MFRWGCLFILLCGLLCVRAARVDPPDSRLHNILLRGGSFVPSREAAVNTMALPAEDDHRAWIVQCDSRKTSAVFNQLQFDRVHYLPHDSFLLECSQQDASRIAQMPGVIWVGLYPDEHKVEPELAEMVASDDCKGESTLRIQVGVVGSNQSPHRVRAAVGTWSLDKSIKTSVSGRFARVEAGCAQAASAIEYLRKQPHVLWIERAPTHKLLNKYSHGITQAGNEQLTPIWDKGIRGADQLVGCADSGLDMSLCWFKDPDHPFHYDQVDWSQRKVVLYEPIADTRAEANSHGTHVVGSICGKAENNTVQKQYDGMAPDAKIVFQDVGKFGERGLDVPNDLAADLFPTPYNLGARLHSNSWGETRDMYTWNSQQIDWFSWQHQDFLALFAAGNSGDEGLFTIGAPATAKNCLTVGASSSSTSSWEQYLSQSLVGVKTIAPVESEVINAVPAAFGPYISTEGVHGPLAIFSPTDGCNPSAQSYTGKIVVIARGTCNFQDKVYYAELAGAIGVIVTNNAAGDAVIMGPGGTHPVHIPSAMVTLADGLRIRQTYKPTDIVLLARGLAQYNLTGNPLFSQTNLAPFSSRGPTPDLRFKPEVVAPGQWIFSAKSTGEDPMAPNCSTTPMQGTSMATPITTGTATLIRDYFAQGFYPSGSPSGNAISPAGSLIKALLINSGVPLTGGVSESGILHPINDRVELQGYGRIQLNNVLYFADSPFKLFIVNGDEGVDQGDVYSKTFAVNPTQPLKVTLVWHDYPAFPSTEMALVNDLDLYVVGANGKWAIGNAVQQVNAPLYDILNNVEQVAFSAQDSSGMFTVYVIGRDVNVGPQPFSLVVTGDFTEADDKNAVEACPSDCSGHGVCRGIDCVCDATFMGVDCSIEIPVVTGGFSESGNQIGRYAWNYIALNVSEVNANSDFTITFQRTGGTGDPDLYMQHGAPPNQVNFDYRNVECDPCGITSHTIKILTDQNKAGLWYIGMFGYCCSNSTYDWQITYSCPTCMNGGQCSADTQYTCVCPEGYAGSRCQSTAIKLSTAAFSSDGSAIDLAFSGATDMMKKSSWFSCSLVFTADTMTTLSGSQCKWTSPTQLQIELAPQCTIVPGDQLALLPDAIQPAAGSGTVTGSVSVAAPQEHTSPRVVLQAPGVTSLCAGLLLDASSSFDPTGRGLAFTWSVDNGAGNDLVNFMSSTHNATVSVPTALLQLGQSYTFTVVGEDFLGGSSTATASVAVRANAAPTIQFEFTSPFIATTAADVELPSTVTLADCLAGNTVVYQWAMEDAPGAVDSGYATTATCLLHVIRLTPSVSYTLSLTACLAADTEACNTASVSVQFQPADIVALLPANFTASQAMPVVLDASASYDPALIPDPLLFTWSCLPLEGPPPCRTLAGSVLTLANQSIVTIPENTLPGITYMFTVNVCKSPRCSSASTSVKIIPLNVPTVVLAPVPAVLPPGEQVVLSGTVTARDVTGLSVTWSVQEGPLTLLPPMFAMAPLTSPTLVIPASMLTPTMSYTLRLTATLGSSSVYSEVTFQIAALPHGGALSITPSNGVVAETPFTLTVQNVISTAPLVYRFGYTQGETVVFLSDWSSSPTVTMTLPMGEPLSVVALARDSLYGGVQTMTESVVVGPLVDSSIGHIQEIVDTAIENGNLVGDMGALLSQLSVLFGSFKDVQMQSGLVEINSQLVNSLVHISTMIPLHALSVQRLVQTAMVLSSRTDLLDTASIQSLTSLLTRLAVRSDSVQALPSIFDAFSNIMGASSSAVVDPRSDIVTSIENMTQNALSGVCGAVKLSYGSSNIHTTGSLVYGSQIANTPYSTPATPDGVDASMVFAPESAASATGCVRVMLTSFGNMNSLGAGFVSNMSLVRVQDPSAVQQVRSQKNMVGAGALSYNVTIRVSSILPHAVYSCMGWSSSENMWLSACTVAGVDSVSNSVTCSCSTAVNAVAIAATITPPPAPNTGLIVGVVIGVILGLLLIIVASVVVYRRRLRRTRPSDYVAETSLKDLGAYGQVQ